MKKNFLTIWLFLVVAMVFADSAKAQVGLGTKSPKPFSVLELSAKTVKGGLRLPFLTTAERDGLSTLYKTDTLFKGLTIFNTTTKCVEYWNNTRWISMCDGTSQTTLFPDPSTCPMAIADGTGGCAQRPFVITDPDCPNGPFEITIVAGGEFTTLKDVDNVEGKFDIVFNVNETNKNRVAVVRVTSSCTGQFKDFMFGQNGIACTAITPPSLTSTPTASPMTLCAGGAVYLSVPAASSDLNKLIWTRNGIEVDRGVSHYTATLSGKYNISMGAAGCNENASNERIVNIGTTAAPVPVKSLISSNDAVICGTNTVKLTALGNPTNVAWFHNGILDGRSTSAIITLTGAADAGEWFVAVGDAGCYSKPSNTVNVVYQAGSGTSIIVNNADALVNGTTIDAVTDFCQGGTLNLQVNNKQADVTYTWYNGDVVIVSPYTIPAAQTSIILRLVATDNTGVACPAEASTSEKQITGGAAPAMPSIVGNSILCGGTSDLSITPIIAGDTYTWYEGDTKLPATTQTITVNKPGVVYAIVTTASGCVSPRATKIISTQQSELPTLSWKTSPSPVNFGEKKTYVAEMDYPSEPMLYKWSADGGATVPNTTGPSITVTFPAGTTPTTINVKVTGSNACGESPELVFPVTVNNACPSPVVTLATASIVDGVQGSPVSLKVNVTSGIGHTYQWYNSSGGAIIPGATSATYVYTPPMGEASFYCIVKNSCTGTPETTSPVVTVKAIGDPTLLPTGTGAFVGKTCFDIATTGSTAGCGTLVSRTPQKTDFSLTALQDLEAATTIAPYSANQVYTFTTSGAGISNVRFIKVDPTGIITSLTPAGNYSGSIASGTKCKVTVAFDPALNTRAAGLTTANALKADVFVIYTQGGEKALKLTATVKDCSCCGAPTNSGGWLTFMCHNLGADESLDPFTPNPRLAGDFYQWGERLPAYKMDGTKTANFHDGATTDYFVSILRNAWNSGTADAPIKTAKDPCPAGWRIPTKKEIASISATQTKVGPWTDGNKFSGIMVGSGLYFQAAGFYDYQLVAGPVSVGSFATQKISDCAFDGVTAEGVFLSINGAALITIHDGGNKPNATPVRCVAQ